MTKRDVCWAAGCVVLCATTWMLGSQQAGKAVVVAPKAKESQEKSSGELKALQDALEKSKAEASASSKLAAKMSAEHQAYRNTVADIVKRLDKAAEDVTIAEVEKTNFERLSPETQFALMQAIQRIKESGIGSLTEDQLKVMDRSPITRRFANQELKKLREKNGKKQEKSQAEKIYEIVVSEVGEPTLDDRQENHRLVMKRFREAAK